MPFKYACFISYNHGKGELVKSFVNQLRQALTAELEPLLAQEVYWDEEQLQPSDLFNEGLAQAICESVCMVVVYSPSYEREEYTRREFEAMTKLEAERRKLLGAGNEATGFIIPVILRTGDEIPPRIRQHRHYCDLSKFCLASTDLARHPEYAPKIRAIADVIYQRFLAFDRRKLDPCDDCLTFRIPDVAEVAPWRPAFPNR